MHQRHNLIMEGCSRCGGDRNAPKTQPDYGGLFQMWMRNAPKTQPITVGCSRCGGDRNAPKTQPDYSGLFQMRRRQKCTKDTTWLRWVVPDVEETEMHRSVGTRDSHCYKNHLVCGRLNCWCVDYHSCSQNLKTHFQIKFRSKHVQVWPWFIVNANK
jgi:hypothetical protein